MKIDDKDFQEMLALLDPKTVPDDPIEAGRLVENFVDLVEILMRPLPLPPSGFSSFREPSSPDGRETSSEAPSSYFNRPRI